MELNEPWYSASPSPVAPAPLQQAAGWLGTYQVFWEDQLASLALHLEQNP